MELSLNWRLKLESEISPISFSVSKKLDDHHGHKACIRK
jgi:hypothetical protein